MKNAGLLIVALLASPALAQGVPIGGWRSPPPPPPMTGPPGGFFGGILWYDQPEVIHTIEVVHEKEVAAPAPAPPPTPREPYVLGKTYDTLPGGCMKMLQGGASYFNCGGMWYRQLRSGGASRYQAVEMP